MIGLLLWAAMMLFAWFSGCWKVLLAIFLLMSLHEAAHWLAAMLVHCPVRRVRIYPFGLCAQIDEISYVSVGSALFILAAGPCMHLLFPFLLQAMASCSLISVSFAGYLMEINRAMLLFNLLPVVPLDGGRIMQTLFHLWLPYAKAQRLGVLCSFAALPVIFLSGCMRDAAGMITLFVLFIQELMQHARLMEERMSFYRYRLSHPFLGRRKVHAQHDLYRNRTNYLQEGTQLIDERTWLKRLFHCRSGQNMI